MGVNALSKLCLVAPITLYHTNFDLSRTNENKFSFRLRGNIIRHGRRRRVPCTLRRASWQQNNALLRKAAGAPAEDKFLRCRAVASKEEIRPAAAKIPAPCTFAQKQAFCLMFPRGSTSFAGVPWRPAKSLVRRRGAAWHRQALRARPCFAGAAPPSRFGVAQI